MPRLSSSFPIPVCCPLADCAAAAQLTCTKRATTTARVKAHVKHKDMREDEARESPV